MSVYLKLPKAQIVIVILFLIVSSCTNQEKQLENNNKEENNELSQEPFDRKVELEGQANMRDLGNYTTSDDYKIKTGILFRTGTFSKLTDVDVEVLSDLGIKTVVNFLSETEIEKYGEDRLPSGVSSIKLPISGSNNEAEMIVMARLSGNFLTVPTEFNQNIHKSLPESGKNAYLNFFKLLADSTNYPIAFHCSHGIHRTGTATALLLGMLDVPWNQIESDYLLSSEYRMEESLARIENLDSIARVESPGIDYDLNRKNIEAFYLLDAQYIMGTKMHIEENYGSFKKYFLSIGLTEEDLEKIRNNLLSLD